MAGDPNPLSRPSRQRPEGVDRGRARRQPDDVIDDHRGGRGTVGRDVTSGVRWLGGSQVVSQLVRIVTAVILTRLLTPAEFGIVTLVSVITGLFERVFGDTGTGAALVRQPSLKHGLATSVFWLNVVVGTATSLFFILLGGPIASLLGEPDAASLVRVVGLTGVIGGFGHAQRALLRRLRRFGPLAAVNFSNAAVTAGATIVLALMDWGEWSLVVGSLIGTAFSIVLAWFKSPWRPTFYFSRSEVRQISRFSTNLSLQSLFGYFSYAGDRFVIGRFIGTTQLGYYGLANRLLRYPLQTSAQTYREVMLPTLARIQDDHQAMRDAYRRTLEGIAFLIVPLCLAVTALAEPMVLAVLGRRWVPATDVLRIMALVSALQAITTTTGSIYNAKGRTDLSLRWQLIASAVMMVSYSIGAFWGINGVAWGFLAGIAALSYPSFRIPLKLIDTRPRQVLSGLVPTFVSASVAAGAAWLVSDLVGDRVSSPWPPLIAGSLVMIAIYAGYAFATKPAALVDLLRTVDRRKRRRGAHGRPAPATPDGDAQSADDDAHPSPPGS